MTLSVHTARVSYAAADRLDITRKSAGPDGLPFAPSWRILRPMLETRRAQGVMAFAYAWLQYADDYTAEMRASYREHRPAWDRLLTRGEVTLVCYCTDAMHCHRTLLAGILGKLGAVFHGERVAWAPQHVARVRRGSARSVRTWERSPSSTTR
jgi:hypothetical protein